MKLMAIIGSPRKGGNTEILADRVIEGYLSKTDADVEKIMVTGKKRFNWALIYMPWQVCTEREASEI